MKRFRFYFDNEINSTHIEKHNVSEEEIKKIIREVLSDRKNIELSKFKINKPENRE